MKFLNGILLLLVVAVVCSQMAQRSGAVFTSGTGNPRTVVSAAADWTPPVVSVTNPGSPLRGSVTVAASATDAHGQVASVRIQRSAAGAGQWTDLCTRTAAPWSCSWDTTAVGDGSYDLRAIATDNSGNTATSAVIASRIVDNRAPVVALADPGSYVKGSVSLQATASDAGTGVTSVTIQRSVADANSWTTICTVTAAPYTCSLNTKAGQTPDGDYDFRAVAADGAGNSATDLVGSIVDNTNPTTGLTVPGSPLRGVVTFSTSPADAGTHASGVNDVTVQVSPAGAGTWTTACVATAAPWSCTWNSANAAAGSYDFRAVVNDAVGNSGTSATVTRTVDNTVSTIYMNDAGAYLRGTVTLQPTVSGVVGSGSVRIQISAAGANSWSTLCTTTAAPWSCPFDTTTRTDAAYDFRAVLTDASGTKNSNVVTSRVDNTALRGTDVQSANAGTVGRVEAGDTLTLTYSELVLPGSLVTGWDGAAALPVAIRVRDGGLLGLTGRDDTIDVFTDTGLKTAVRIGTVNSKSDLLKGGKTVVLNGTMTRSGATASTITLTVGTLVSGGGVRTATDKVAMIWTPSAAATDPAGNPSSAAPVTQSGALHVNF